MRAEAAEAWRCLLVEDDDENARYISEGFRSLGYQVVVCDTAEGARPQLMTQSWDLVILDRMLPGNRDGLALLSEMRSSGKQMPVLVLSALSALDERVRGLKVGGDDYLTKPFDFPELAARAEALVRRTRGNVVSVLEMADLRVDLTHRRVERAGRVVNLQPREFRLLAYMMMHPGQVLTRSMLLEAVWDFRFDPNTNVIEMQISRLRSKLDFSGAKALIHTVRGVGYRMTAEEDDL